MALIALGTTLSTPGRIQAAEVTGMARVEGGNTSNQVEGTELNETDSLNQRYLVTLLQPVTPWFSFQIAYRYERRDATPTFGLDTQRTLSEPYLELSYRRQTFDVRLSYRDRTTRGTSERDNLDADSFTADLTWRPRRGPIFTLRFRDDKNVADVVTFGRDVQTRSLDANVLYAGRNWDARYGFGRLEVENRLSRVELTQNQHEVRGSFQDRFLENRLAFSVDGYLNFVEQEQRAPSGQTFTQPIPPSAGLQTIDTTPEIGPLENSPDLIDGDTETPTVPRIEIGSANIFRNIGVSVGIIRLVSQLEITVNALSDPLLVWEVWQSNDNFNWEPVPGAVSVWDETFLRYEIRFPPTANQFFKAVNVSTNSQPEVAVTEIRVFQEVEQIGVQDGESTRVRVNSNVIFTPNSRVTGSVGLGYNDDRDRLSQLAVRGLRETFYNATLGVVLGPTWDFNGSYRASWFDETGVPVPRRQETISGIAFTWLPLPAVEGTFAFSRREEDSGGTLLRRNDNLRVRFNKAIYPALTLTSELSYSDVDDPFAGFTQQSLRWSETIDSRPGERWALGGGFSLARFDSVGRVTLTRRDTLNLRVTWFTTPVLTMNGFWNFVRDDNQRNLNQQYTLSWAPTRKIAASLSYRDNETPDVRRTTGGNLGLDYRLTRAFRLFVNLARSRQQERSFPESTFNSIHYGLHLLF